MARDVFESTVPPDALSVEEWNKLKFVEQYLGPMVMAATEGVVHACEYAKSTYGPEAVLMRARFGVDRAELVEFRADVTGLGRWDMAKETMRAVARIWG